MKNFNELQLSVSLQKAIAELGYESPTPIQSETLPLLLGADTDFLGLAATGTGKTAAFGIPLLERIDRNKAGVQALILCPTRELAIQVSGQIDLLGKFLGVKSLPIYGGTGYGDQIYGLKNGATIVVGTPGRVVDHIDKGTLKLNNLKTLVLDEADEMISMGFKEDLETVLKSAPKNQANIWLFSATMGREVRGVADAYLKNPQKVQVNTTEMLPDTVEQLFYKVHEYDKPQVLCKLIDAAENFYGIVFCQTKALVADLNQFLSSNGYRADCLHGDLDQNARDRVMKAFRERKVSILIATDVACRGLDVKDITHVVNYSIPRELDNYVHRIGRTGRSGKQGIAMSFVTYSHRELIGRIERMTKSRMTEGTVPTNQDIALKRVAKVQTAFTTVENTAKAQALLPEAWKLGLAEMSKEEITARFLALLMPDLFDAKKSEERMPDSRPEQKVRPESTGHRPAPRRDSRPPRESSEAPRFKPKFEKRSFRKPSEGGGSASTPWENRSRPPSHGPSANSRWKGKPGGHQDRPSFSAKPKEFTPSFSGGGENKPKKRYVKYETKKPKSAPPLIK